MKKRWNFLWIVLIIAIWIVAYSIVTDPYNQAKRDKMFIGPSNASVTVISFIDYTNGDSASSEFTMKMLRQNYKDELKFIYKYYNSSNLSMELAMAAECAAGQEKFEKMHDKLFENYFNLTSGSAFIFADQIYLRKDEFRACMDKKLYEQSILKDYQLAKMMKITKLPTIFINGKKIEGLQNLSVYSDIIDKKLNN